METLFDPPSQRHSTTSVAAANAIKRPAHTLRAEVFAYIQSRGPYGACDHEISEALQMNPSTARPRRIECWRAGVIRDSGSTRLTASGRKAVVWVAA